MRFSIRQRPVLAAAVLATAVALTPFTSISGQQAERVDLDAIYKIKEEGFARSRVMEIMSWLTDVYGPRLTNSPGFRKAGDWAVKEMTSWGLANVKLQPFGPFGRGWANEKFYMMATTPGGALPVIGYPQAWTSGTNGLVSGDAIFATLDTPEDLAQWKGKLKGKVLFATALRDVPPLFERAGTALHRRSNSKRSQSETDAVGRGRTRRTRAAAPAADAAGQRALRRLARQFLHDEGVLAVVTPGRGRAARSSSAAAVRAKPNAPARSRRITIAVEHYGRIVRTLEKEQPVTIDLDVKNTFYDDTMSLQRRRRDSGHRQGGRARHAGRALRLVAQRHRRHRQRRRLGGDDGSHAHPQGLGPAAAPHRAHRLVGRRGAGAARIAAVRERHFADRTTMALKPAHAKFSGYFNVDNGTGAIRGVYLQGNEAVAPIFEAWMKPFSNLGMTTLTIRDTGGTDHQAFDAVGLPGLPVHSGSGRVQHPDAPLEHGSSTSGSRKRT